LAAGSAAVSWQVSQAATESGAGQQVSRSGKAILTGSRIELENSWVRRIIERKDGAWRTRSFSRADGSDEVRVGSDEFTVLLMGSRRLTVEDYRAQGDPVSRK
jgi:hypothetical protein